MQQSKKTQVTQGGMNGKVVAELGIVALAAAAAGALFLYGTDAGQKRRQQARSWMLRMKADVMEKMEKMNEWNEGAYNAIVDAAGARYASLKNIDVQEVTGLISDLKKQWHTIKRTVGTARPASKGSSTKAVTTKTKKSASASSRTSKKNDKTMKADKPAKAPKTAKTKKVEEVSE
jgi:hypothetical protein